MPLPIVIRSGITPNGSIAPHVPVRPAPHNTSSATNRTPCRSQTSRTARKYPACGTFAPVDEPPTGAARDGAAGAGPGRGAGPHEAPRAPGGLAPAVRPVRAGGRAPPGLGDERGGGAGARAHDRLLQGAGTAGHAARVAAAAGAPPPPRGDPLRPHEPPP